MRRWSAFVHAKRREGVGRTLRHRLQQCGFAVGGTGPSLHVNGYNTRGGRNVLLSGLGGDFDLRRLELIAVDGTYPSAPLSQAQSLALREGRGRRRLLRSILMRQCHKLGNVAALLSARQGCQGRGVDSYSGFYRRSKFHLVRPNIRTPSLERVGWSQGCSLKGCIGPLTPSWLRASTDRLEQGRRRGVRHRCGGRYDQPQIRS